MGNDSGRRPPAGAGAQVRVERLEERMADLEMQVRALRKAFITPEEDEYGEGTRETDELQEGLGF